MSFGLEAGIFLAYAAGLFLIYVLGKLLIVPAKWLGKLLLSSLAGGLFIFLLNFLKVGSDALIPLNPLTALITGALGIPGILCLLALFNIG